MAFIQLLRGHWSGTWRSWSSAGPQPSAVGLTDALSSPLPATIGRFQIKRELGQGGYGIVFLADDRELGREVALKIPRADVLVTPDLRARFHHEARAAASLDHSNIVQVYEAGEIGPLCYIAAAYCPGPTLAEWLKQRTDLVPFDVAAAIVVALADAVQHAHSRGVLHRDLKPANVLLEEEEGGEQRAEGQKHDGGHSSVDRQPASLALSSLPSALRPRITDFGLAKLLEEADSVRTRTGTILGTPNYMAPEQAAGRNKDVSTATDVYALGVILYELLTGRPPFQSDTPLETMRKVESDEPTPPSRLRPKLPRDLETICLKCLQKEPSRRFASAAALADDLRHFLAGEPVGARPVSVTERLVRWCRRQPMVAGLAASVSLLIVGIAVIAPISAVSFRHQRDTAIRLKTEADEAKLGEERAKGDALERLRDARLAEAQARRWSGQHGRRFKSLEALKEAAAIRPSLELRNEAVACMPLVDLRVHKSWELERSGDWMCFDAALEAYHVEPRDGHLIVRRAADGSQIARLADPSTTASYPWFTLSPNAEYLAARYDLPSRVCVWNLRSGELVLETPSPPGPCGMSAQHFMRDGRQIAVGLADGTIRFYDLASGNEVKRLVAAARPGCLAFDPTEQKLAVFLWFQRTIQIFDVNTGSVERTIDHPVGPSRVDWHPDGRVVAVSAGRNIYLWDADTWTQRAVLEGHQSEGVSARFNHRGDLLASSAYDGTTRLWDTTTGKELVSMPGSFDEFSADDRFVTFGVGQKKAGIWEVATGRECRTFHAPAEIGSGPWFVDWTPDGRLMASPSDDGVRLWDVATGKQIALLPTGQCRSALFFDPAGESLITSSARGILHWRITTDPTDGNVQIGPPQIIHEPFPTSGSYGASLSRDGHWFGLAIGRDQAVVLNVDSPSETVTLDGHAGVTQVAISPDGHWVATGAQHGSGIKVWDARNGKLEQDLPAASFGVTEFSPDGRLLVTTSIDTPTQIYEVGTWQLRHELKLIGGGATFSRDGSMLAVKHSRTLITLFDPVTGDELATLPAPNPLPIGGMSFSPDGSQLAAACYNFHTIQLWDLRAIRRELEAMKLDWNLPSFPSPASAADTTAPVRSDTLLRRANLRKRYAADGGHACTGSSFK